MTMHLDVRLNTLKTSKPKSKKITEKEHAQLMENHRVYNKKLKQQGRHSERLTFDEYVDYIKGRAKLPQKSAEFREYLPQKSANYRETKEYKSLDTSAGIAPRMESKQYTGTLVKGIATMHKSNAVPVINQQEAIDIANMRRN